MLSTEFIQHDHSRTDYFHKNFIFELLIYASIKIIVSRHILSTILVKVLILPTCIIYTHIYVHYTYYIYIYNMHTTILQTYIICMSHVLYIHI